MYRFTVEHGVALPALELIATHESPVTLRAVTSSSHSSDPSASRTSVPFRVGAVRLMRNVAYKGQFLVPFLPTRHLLLVFPSSLDAAQRNGFAVAALEKMSCFLSNLKVSSSVDFTVDAVDLCRVTGVAAVTLTCQTTEVALDVLSAAEQLETQTDAMRMSSVYIRCYPVEVGLLPLFGGAKGHGDHSTSASSDAETEAKRLEDLLLNHYYYIPLCPICADRLELTLTGIAEGQSLCVCHEQHCHCMRTSPCVVCQAVVQSHQPPNSQSAVHLACEACGQAGDPWICLICGYVGCSRYQAMHAKDHYLSHRHFFSLNVTTQQVWDYESDDFVHRTIMQPGANGDMHRVQYESRENPYVNGEFEDDMLGDSVCDPGLAKKNVTAKYDLKLSGSHAQYATLLKNELDSMRQLLYAQHTAQRGLSVDVADESTQPSTRLPRVVDSPYEAMGDQADSIIHAFQHQSHLAMSSFLSLQHTEYELQKRKGETEQLDVEAAALSQAIRDAIQHNIAAVSQLDTAIKEQKDLIKDLRLNSRVSADLSHRLASGDGLARVVAVEGSSGQRSGTKKSTDATARRKRT